MRKHLLAILAVTAALTPAAHAATPTYAGDVCGYAAYADPSIGDWEGVLYGGPLVVADLPTMLPSAAEDLLSNPVAVTLDCTFKVDGVPVAATSGSGQVAVIAGPVVFRYYDDGTAHVELCSAVTITHLGGSPERYYWDDVANRFSADPAAPCYIQNSSDYSCPLAAGDDCGLHPDTLDELICPELAKAFPPEGDIEGVWDCPPYDG